MHIRVCKEVRWFFGINFAHFKNVDMVSLMIYTIILSYQGGTNFHHMYRWMTDFFNFISTRIYSVET